MYPKTDLIQNVTHGTVIGDFDDNFGFHVSVSFHVL